MMKVDRILFSKIISQYEILKMKAAYILAEQEILRESHNGMADGISQSSVSLPWETTFSMTPEDMWQFDAGYGLSGRDLQIKNLEDGLLRMEEKGRQFLKEEKYEEMKELKELYDQTIKTLNKLKNQ